jgi:hypothetical protein
MESANKIPTNLVIAVTPIVVMVHVQNALVAYSGITHTATETRLLDVSEKSKTNVSYVELDTSSIKEFVWCR